MDAKEHHRGVWRRAIAIALNCALLFLGTEVRAENGAGSALPDMGASVLRMLGALGFVLAMFFGAVWVYRNWQRFAVRKGNLPKLNVIEAKSLGGRHALYLVGYQEQRFLIGSSPNGINMLAQLPQQAQEIAPETKPAGQEVPASFLDSLKQVLARKGQA